jgi:hypothetical protein
MIRLFLNNLHLHLNPLNGIVRFVSWSIDDLVCGFHSRDNLAEDGIFPVEEGGIGHADEKLRPRTVRMLGSRHRENASLMLFIIKLRFQCKTGPAHSMFGSIRAPGIRIPALNHESWDNAMKCGPIIKSFFRQFNKAGHMSGCNFREELDLHIAKACFDDDFGFGHFLDFLWSKMFKSHLCMGQLSAEHKWKQNQ